MAVEVPTTTVYTGAVARRIYDRAMLFVEVEELDKDLGAFELAFGHMDGLEGVRRRLERVRQSVLEELRVLLLPSMSGEMMH